MHNIIYFDYKENTAEKIIGQDVLNYVKSHGDRYGTEKVTFRGEIFDSRDEAVFWIEKYDDGWYRGIAVKYYDYSACKKDKKNAVLKWLVKFEQAFVLMATELNCSPWDCLANFVRGLLIGEERNNR